MNFPLTTTLNRIWACNPCAEGKERALKAAGKDAPDDEPITYQQIVEATGIKDALWCCKAEPHYDLIWRKYAVRCARKVQGLLDDKRSIEALNVAERFTNGMASEAEIRAAFSGATAHLSDASRPLARSSPWFTSRAVAWCGVSPNLSWYSARIAFGAAADALGDASVSLTQEFIQLVTTGSLPE